ncbi:MAG: integral membrane [Lasallia pustulata]|uniref:Integral membrane n=1 Tax=Lasallia pustulata TaxID=136370 RepID=A0A5M8PM14_9LECA|nr:MAG: integral membrane [Lasallia pustulata]
MPLERRMYSSAPPAQTAVQNNPTLLVSWWCTGFALVIIVLRLSGRYIRTERLFGEDKIMALSIIPLMIRMALIHVVLIWGTNNAVTTGLTAEEIRHREIGSRLVLASRIMYAAFLWVAKFTVSEFLKRLTEQVWRRSYQIGLQFIRWFLVLTFIGVVIATLSECHPFTHYWQVVPDPGPQCRQGYAQLITMGASDVITDLLLIVFPIPIIIRSAMPMKRKISLVLLFSLSAILIGITVYRVTATVSRHSNQQFRSLLASLEILAAAAVSNALVLGSFVRDRGVKKQRFRFGSTSGSDMDRPDLTRRGTLTAMTWGSDSDLVGDLGIRLGPEFSNPHACLPRPAPVALPHESYRAPRPPDAHRKGWAFPDRVSADSDETDDMKSPTLVRTPRPADGSLLPRRASFFDIGGLLEDGKPAHSPQRGRPLLLPAPSPPHPPPRPRSTTAAGRAASRCCRIWAACWL